MLHSPAAQLGSPTRLSATCDAVGRDIEVDCRRRLGIRSFSSSLPPDLGLRTSFGREGGHAPGRYCREDPASGAAAPLN
jgi:hypothetical protein